MVFKKKKTKTTTKRRITMPKKKTYRRKTSRSKINFGAAVVSSLGSPMIKAGVSKLTGGKMDPALALTGLGWLGSKKSGFWGDLGVAFFYANSDNVIQGLMGGGLLGGIGITDGITTGGAI